MQTGDRRRALVLLIALLVVACDSRAALRDRQIEQEPAMSSPEVAAAPSPSTMAPELHPTAAATGARPGPVASIPAAPAQAILTFEASAGPAVDLTDAAGSGSLEPIVATHPTDPAVLALAYTRAGSDGSSGGSGMASGVRVSRDGGRSWRETRAHPWSGSGRRPSLHAAVAWGPGPSRAARLYWVGTVTAAGGVRIGTSYSDDLGNTWSRLLVVNETPAWVGGFPDVGVDRDPGSPAFGVAYVTYNYREARGRGAGIRLMASGDFGRSWHGTDVARAATDGRFRVSWRFGSRVRSAPDGGVYVSSYQADMRTWDPTDVFDRGGMANVGRIGFTITRLNFDRRASRFTAGPTIMATTIARNAYTTSRRIAPGTRSHTYLDPMWSHGLAVEPTSGRVLLAIADVARRAGEPRGTIRVGRSDDRGRTWAWVTLAATPPSDGRIGSSFRPTLAVSKTVIFVGLHTIDDVATDATIGTAFATSWDGGETFGAPELVPQTRWRASALERAVNGPGLRDRADVTAGGDIVYVYGDGRIAPIRGHESAGRRQVFVALFSIAGAT